ncbi:MAG: hypothetical protein JWM33_1887 [Caulobacteraceae bacterium]|nr:hypothetical protein [Caulobacteraceae bacterium]
MKRPVAKGKSGFTLIEVLVALAIASFAFYALFGLQQQLLDGQRRGAATIDRANMVRNASVLLAQVNPSDPDIGPSGVIDLPPNMTLNWTAEPVTPDQTYNTTFPGTTQASWYVQLWKITGEVTNANGEVIQSLTLERLGYANPSDVAGDSQ